MPRVLMALALALSCVVGPRSAYDDPAVREWRDHQQARPATNDRAAVRQWLHYQQSRETAGDLYSRWQQCRL